MTAGSARSGHTGLNPSLASGALGCYIAGHGDNEVIGLSRRQVVSGGIGVIAGGAGVLAAACGGQQQAAPANVAEQPARLSLVVDSGPLAEMWADGIATVQREYPTFKIEPIVVQGGGWGGYFEKVTAMVTAGTPPDVIRIATEGFRLLAHKGMLLPLDALIKRDASNQLLKDFLADVNKDMMRLTTYNGKQFALPFSMNVPVIHYNTALFDAAGVQRPSDSWTIDDFERIARQLSRPEQDQWGFRTTAALWGGVCPFLAINGADFISDDYKQSRANDPRTVEAVERYASYGTRLRIAPPGGAAAMEQWNAGKLGMLLSGANAPAGFIRGGMKDFDVLPVPKWRSQTHIVGGGSLGLAKESKQHEPAWHVLKYIYGRPDVLTKFVPATVPSRRSIRYSMPIAEGGPPKNFKIYADVQNHGLREVPSPPEYVELEPMVLQHLRAALNNDTSPKAAMDNLHRDMTELLSRRTAPVG
jgi:multiple sugar transport system substrate-binding protein